MLEGRNHILLEREPVWPRFLAAVSGFLDQPEPQAAADPRVARLDDLTRRETEVLALISRGLSNAEIAQQLVVSAATVRNHITRIFRKLGVRDRAQAVIVALEGGRR